MLRDLRIEVSARKSQGCGDGGRRGVLLVFVSRFWLLGREYRWGRETLPARTPQRDYLLKVRLSKVTTFHRTGARTCISAFIFEVRV